MVRPHVVYAAAPLARGRHKAEDQDKWFVNGVTLLLAGSACNRQPWLASTALCHVTGKS